MNTAVQTDARPAFRGSTAAYGKYLIMEKRVLPVFVVKRGFARNSL